MKYVVVIPCDQTITFLTFDNGETIDHKNAGLWDTKEEAEKARLAYEPMADESFVEEILDEVEFRSRPKTW